jgi:ribonuclease E
LLFQKFGIDTQLSDIFKPIVNLKSGGYLVINHTEALVAVDVNSGKATKERSIEKTAFQTNLEAAQEFARQAKLRDLSGLIVIDFIDMEDYKNRNTIERKLKEAFKQDRARIQIGEISSFGLLELSRQRLRLSVSETTTEVCNFCGGVGRIQSYEVTSMQILREAEDSLVKSNQNEISISIHSGMSAYILNNKKQNIFDIENRHKAKIIFNIDNNLTISDYKIEKSEDRKIVDLKAENQHKDQISKKRKNQKKSRDNNDTLYETNTDLDKKKDPFLAEKKNKKGTNKAKIIFNIDNNLTISDYKLENSEDRKIVDLKAENQYKDQISKKRKNQKKSRNNNHSLN